MVPNCIFLHLFHISRSTGFLKKKKKKIEEGKKKKNSIHKWNEGIKNNNAGFLLPPFSPSILPLISFLTWF